MMSRKKAENLGRFSVADLKKQYGKDYQVITKKNYKDLSKRQKKLFDLTSKNYQKNSKTNKLIVIGKKNKSTLGIPPRKAFSNIEEIDYRSDRMIPTNITTLRGTLRKGKRLKGYRELTQGTTDEDIQRGKTSAAYSMTEEFGINPKTYTPVVASNPRMRILKNLKRMSTEKDYGAETNKAAKLNLKKFSKKVLGKVNGGSVHVKSKLGRTKPTKVF